MHQAPSVHVHPLYHDPYATCPVQVHDCGVVLNICPLGCSITFFVHWTGKNLTFLAPVCTLIGRRHVLVHASYMILEWLCDSLTVALDTIHMMDRVYVASTQCLSAACTLLPWIFYGLLACHACVLCPWWFEWKWRLFVSIFKYVSGLHVCSVIFFVVTSPSGLFWQSPKRPPTPVDFDPNNSMWVQCWPWRLLTSSPGVHYGQCAASPPCSSRHIPSTYRPFISLFAIILVLFCWYSAHSSVSQHSALSE